MLTPETVLQGRYRIIRQLGQGGMGAVYEAVDERLDTVVALKETLFTDERLRKQFEREARLLARLHHQALPRVSDHFNEGDGQFLVMQYIAGEDLFEMLARRNGPFAQEEVLRWADQLCDALDYLHTQDPQIIHRDIKPQNLKLTARGQMVLLDFGLAKGSAGQMSVVTSASIFGYTPNYAPLEQVQGLGTDARSDIYALAATLYHLVANVKPPDALSRAGAIVNGQDDPLHPANHVNPQVSSAVAAVLAKGMSQKRDDRYASAVAMREVLRAAAEHPLGDAKTILASESAAFADANTAASEQRTKVAGEQTKPMASEAQTLLTDEATNVRGTAASAEVVTAVRSPSASGSRIWLAAALLLVLIAGGAGGFYAYRARHREAQQTAAPPSQNPAQPGESNPTASSSVDNSAQTDGPRASESKTEKAADTSSQRTSTSKQTTDKSADTTKSSTDQSKNPTAPAHDVERNPDRNSNSNSGKSSETPSNDQGRNPGGRGHPRLGDQPGTRTFPNGTKVVTQPDGTRIVTMPNGTTRVIPPGEKLNRRRNRIP